MVSAMVSYCQLNICSDFAFRLFYQICFHILRMQTQFNIASFFIPVMDGSLPTSLKHIISNAEYYGPSLFLLGKSVVEH